ncbi:armadillo repeat-containing protein 4 armc4 [Anaeramoeba flamelloides]|uniref:Armadillo repeat-containing protein 4 armc4 n=1 Tax=Anaeramoeba flamelloides TaxID=1746091 RepID=A0AAV7Z290_9EUKA|nr:armadillo repeat-containing protein 4 armc4 [Anaeramoeba flamelloides]
METYSKTLELLSSMRKNSTSQELLINNLATLNNLAVSTSPEGFHQCVRENSGVEFVVSLSRRYSKSWKFLEKAFAALRNVGSDEQNCQLLGKSGSFSLASQALNEHLGRQSLITNILAMLSNASQQEKNRKVFLQEPKLIRSILNSIRQYNQEKEILANGIRTLLGLSLHLPCAIKLVEEGGVLVLKEILQDYNTTQEIQSTIFGVLNNLCVDDVNCVIIGRSGIIRPICSIIYNTSNNANNNKNDFNDYDFNKKENEQEQEQDLKQNENAKHQILLYGFSLLANLASNSHNNKLLIENNSISIGINYINGSAKNNNNKKKNNNKENSTLEIIEKILLLFQNFSPEISFATTLINANKPFQALIPLLTQKHDSSEIATFRIINILMNLSHQKIAHQALTDQKVLLPLISLIEHTTQKKIKMCVRALTVLYHLSQTKENRKKIVLAGSINSVIYSLQQFMDNEEVVDIAAAIITNLSIEIDSRKEIKYKRGLNLLQNALQKHKFNKKITEQIERALKNLQTDFN